MTTRTVQLSPIEAEVCCYLDYLKAEGIKVVSVNRPTTPGVNYSITFEG